jgi:hypothetical protein
VPGGNSGSRVKPGVRFEKQVRRSIVVAVVLTWVTSDPSLADLKHNYYSFMLRTIAALAILCCFASTSQAQLRGPADVDSLERNIPTYIEMAGDIAWGPNTTFLFAGGVGVVTRVAENIRAGVTDLTYASADQLQSNRHSITFAPAVEYYKYLSESVALQGRFAVPLQIRWGAGMDSKLGVQPYLQAGVDLLPSELFSIGGYVRGGYVATDGFIRTPRVLPASAVALSGGLNLKFHF